MPAGRAPHTYRFTLYALDQQAELPDASPAPTSTVAGPSSLAVAEVTGTYARP